MNTRMIRRVVRALKAQGIHVSYISGHGALGADERGERAVIDIIDGGEELPQLRTQDNLGGRGWILLSPYEDEDQDVLVDYTANLSRALDQLFD